MAKLLDNTGTVIGLETHLYVPYRSGSNAGTDAIYSRLIIMYLIELIRSLLARPRYRTVVCNYRRVIPHDFG